MPALSPWTIGDGCLALAHKWPMTPRRSKQVPILSQVVIPSYARYLLSTGGGMGASLHRSLFPRTTARADAAACHIQFRFAAALGCVQTIDEALTTHSDPGSNRFKSY